MKRLFSLVVLSLFIQAALSGQDIHFSQFTLAPLSTNPASAGITKISGNINYKNQWLSVGTPYKTFAASCSVKAYQDKSRGYLGAGINFSSDKAGDNNLKQAAASLSLAYHLRIGEYSTLGLGLVGGISGYSMNYSTIQTGSQFDGSSYNPNLPTNETGLVNTRPFADCGAGMIWNFENTSGASNVTDNHNFQATIGFSAFHINQPVYSFFGNRTEKLAMKYILHGNAVFSLSSSNVAFCPAFMAALQRPQQEILAGVLFRYMLNQNSKYTDANKQASVSFGGYMRVKDAIIPSVLLEYDHYAMGLTYDVNISRLRAASSMRGGIEIALRYRFI